MPGSPATSTARRDPVEASFHAIVTCSYSASRPASEKRDANGIGVAGEGHHQSVTQVLDLVPAVGNYFRPKRVEHVVAQRVGRRVAETRRECGGLDEIAEQKSDRRGQRFPQEWESTSRPE